MSKQKYTLAYFESMYSGLVPCQAIDLDSSELVMTVRVTANRGPYQRGEIIKVNTIHVIARARVHVRDGIYRIRPGDWNTSDGIPVPIAAR